MRILDRQRYWAFLKAYVICFFALVGLYVVIDAFSNIDEFFKVEEQTLPVLRNMGWYYLVRTSLFYDRLCGVITMMAAIFTVTWLQKDNELLAMLAAGISTKRVIVPVLVSAALISGLAILNQEFIIPQLEDELQKTPDDDGKRKIRTFPRRDINEILIVSDFAYRAEQTIEPFSATLPSSRFGVMIRLDGQQARYIPPDDPVSTLRGGWVIRGADISPAHAVLDREIVFDLESDPWRDMATGGGFSSAIRTALAGLPPARGDSANLPGRTFFLRTNLSFTILTRSKQWYQLATTPDLIRSLRDPSCEGEWKEIAVYLHNRNIRPLLSMTLLCLSLPLVLGGDARNTFINLGRSLGTSAAFYIVLFVSGYLGNNDVISAELAAWAPLIGFGTIAAARWDRIRT